MREEILAKLREVVDEKRYRHSILAAEAARDIAEARGLDGEKAYTAGLLHDIAKRFSAEENRYFVEKYALDPELLNAEAKNFVHADVGAAAAKEWFDVDDEIYEAIRLHTIPEKGMSDFSKVIFLADKVGREELSLEMREIKELAKENLDGAMLKFLLRQEEELKERGIKQHPRTAEVIRELAH